FVLVRFHCFCSRFPLCVFLLFSVSSPRRCFLLSFPTRRSSDLDFVVFRFTVENSVETGNCIRSFQKGETPHDGYTRGLYYRGWEDRKSTRLNSSHVSISYAVFCLKKKIN